MKVTADDLQRTLMLSLHLQMSGRMYRLVAVTTTEDEANAHMAEHTADTLLAHYDGLCLLADKKDVGIRAPEDVVRELLLSIDYASPSEMQGAANWLRSFANDMGNRQAQRHIARTLAPVIARLGK